MDMPEGAERSPRLLVGKEFGRFPFGDHASPRQLQHPPSQAVVDRDSGAELLREVEDLELEPAGRETVETLRIRQGPKGFFDRDGQLEAALDSAWRSSRPDDRETPKILLCRLTVVQREEPHRFLTGSAAQNVPESIF
jgi:hypothetical protein